MTFRLNLPVLSVNNFQNRFLANPIKYIIKDHNKTYNVANYNIHTIMAILSKDKSNLLETSFTLDLVYIKL